MEDMSRYGFRIESGSHVAHLGISTGKALDNREIRVTISKAGDGYRIHLVDMTANRRKLLARGQVSSVDAVMASARLFKATYESLG
jgi:hypothetical protein